MDEGALDMFTASCDMHINFIGKTKDNIPVGLVDGYYILCKSIKSEKVEQMSLKHLEVMDLPNENYLILDIHKEN